jgi:hypothetical protein
MTSDFERGGLTAAAFYFMLFSNSVRVSNHKEDAMASLLALGRIASISEAADEFERCVLSRNLFDPEPFRVWADRIKVDEPGGTALILPAGTTVAGDVELDYDNEEVETHRIGTIVALGDFTIDGRLLNIDSDGGPFLLAAGNLYAKDIIKGGASIVVLGSLTSDGAIFCDYNHGTLQVCGNLTAPLLLLNDHEIQVSGTVNSRTVSNETCTLREVLVPEVFFDPDDDEDEWPEGGLIAERLLAGLPVIQDGR